MRAKGRNRSGLLFLAVLLGSASIMLLSLGDRISVGWGGLLALSGIAGAAAVFLQTRSRHGPMNKADCLNAGFRREVERYLSEVSAGSQREFRKRLRDEQEELPKVDEPARSPRNPQGDVLGRITENVEVLGGYREDLVALLQLYRALEDGSRAPEQKHRIRSDIRRFEKTIALDFLLEDSEAVQGETVALVEDLRRWLRHGAVEEGSDETWTPVDLQSRIEMALEKLPDEIARSAWFERSFGEVPLILTRPQSLYEALYHLFDYFVRTVGSGQAIHIRTAQRGEFAWIGIGTGPNEQTAGTIATDERVLASGRIWKNLGGQMVTGESEVRVLLPLHGPASLYSEEAGESAEEKTG